MSKLILKISVVYISFFPLSLTAQPRYLIKMINVGEGDSIFVQDLKTREGFLIDTGTPLASEKIIKTLKKQKLTRLNSIVFTHPHLDHFGGIFGIVPFLKPASFFDNGEDLSAIGKTEDIYRHYQNLVRNQNYRALTAGDSLNLGQLHFEVLAPTATKRSSDWNTNSLVLLLSYQQFKMLLVGDANLETEKILVQDNCQQIKATVLKAGHHAKSDTASNEFLNCVKPDYVFVSGLERGAYSVADKKVMNRYRKDAGKAVYFTAENGDVDILINEDGKYHVKADSEE